MDLTEGDRALMSGDAGPAKKLAMEILVAVGRAEQAPRLLDVSGAHIDACLFHGVAGLQFAERLAAYGGEVSVPTTLNVSSLDLIHPELYRGDPQTAELARKLMDAYVAMGCLPTWTCAPYQLVARPTLGDQIAWGESNAIVFANSVLGARTNRYGDFMDICAALTGRVPETGLHTDEGRLAEVVVDIRLPGPVLHLDITYALIGHALGRVAGTRVAALVGLDERATEDHLKNLGAAAASSGSVAMFHAVGVTPEAPDLGSATGEMAHGPPIVVGVDVLDQARTELSHPSGRLGAVSVGTPHMSLTELADLAALFSGRVTRVPFYVNTSRHVLEEATDAGYIDTLETAGVTLVTDTCTYVTPIMGKIHGDLMTNSGKLAYYAPANLGANVALATLEDCVDSAVAGAQRISSSW